tara:strand:+ start:209 stop:838 length:630 start_codon:yes stop_codon:yes gene_type:complete
MALNLLEVGAVGDRSEPMIELCDYITDNSEVNSAIDLFAGNANDNGSFVSWKLYDICKDVTHIEWDFDKAEALKHDFITDNVICDDTHKVIKRWNKEKFDIVFCDNPQWEHEYFKVIPHIKKLINPGGWFIHNVNVRPYGNFTNDSEWGKNRSEFYELEDTTDMDYVDTFGRVKKRLEEAGVDINYGRAFGREICKGHVYLHFFVWRIK